MPGARPSSSSTTPLVDAGDLDAAMELLHPDGRSPSSCPAAPCGARTGPGSGDYLDGRGHVVRRHVPMRELHRTATSSSSTAPWSRTRRPPPVTSSPRRASARTASITGYQVAFDTELVPAPDPSPPSSPRRSPDEHTPLLRDWFEIMDSDHTRARAGHDHRRLPLSILFSTGDGRPSSRATGRGSRSTSSSAR